ncbi:hypothetical protein U0070_002959 [Myodes glareolus]|uniref:60S ribosomal protein L21 n=1 Tax=Myodes glareolus TaxID=447135 RepID=A0AAW0I710_MYOGA
MGRTHGVVPSVMYMQIYKKGDIADIKGMGTVQKGMPPKCYHGKPGRVHSVTQHTVGITVNKKTSLELLVTISVSRREQFPTQEGDSSTLLEDEEKGAQAL